MKITARHLTASMGCREVFLLLCEASDRRWSGGVKGYCGPEVFNKCCGGG